MYEYLAVTSESKTERVLEIRQEVRMRMARVLMRPGQAAPRYDEAAMALEEYVNTEPCKLRLKALRMLSVAYQKAMMYEPCIRASTNAIAIARESYTPTREFESDGTGAGCSANTASRYRLFTRAMIAVFFIIIYLSKTKSKVNGPDGAAAFQRYIQALKDHR